MLPKTTFEQRSRFYDDVETLLSPGFLTHPLRIAGVPLQMRSLGPGDLFMLRSRAEDTNAHDWRVWAVSTSIWMIDGRSVLGHDAGVPLLREFFRDLPGGSIEILFTILLGLFVRAGNAADIIEKYSYEFHSRYKWKTQGIHGMFNQGVPGADTLGLNLIQRIWVAFNEMEDSRRIETSSWEAAKLVASSNAPKAIKKLDTRDGNRRRDEADRREKQLDLLYYSLMGVVDSKGNSVTTNDHSIRGPKSVEDLEEEMRRWVTGDQDVHDRTVADYKARIIAQHVQDDLECQERRDAVEAERARRRKVGQDSKPKPLVGLTLEQLQHVLRERGPGRAGVSTVTTGPPGGMRQYAYDRYLASDEGAGELQVVDGHVVDPNSNEDVDRRTLNSLIQGRNPAFGSGE